MKLELVSLIPEDEISGVFSTSHDAVIYCHVAVT